MNHIIRQQIFDIEVNGPESVALDLHRQLPDISEFSLLPLFDKIFDRYSTPDSYLYFEYLEIDAGNLTLENLHSELLASLERALEAALSNATRQKVTGKELLPAANQQKTVQQSIFEAFRYFLKTGRLPWWFHLPEGLSLEQSVMANWQQITPKFRMMLRPLLKDPVARRRLVLQFTPEFLQALLTHVSASAGQSMLDIYVQLVDFHGSPLTWQQFSQPLWESAWAAVVNDLPISVHWLISESLRTLAADESIKIAWLDWLTVRHPDTVKLVKTMPSNLQQAERRNLSEHLSQLDRDEHRTPFEQARYRQSKSLTTDASEDLRTLTVNESIKIAWLDWLTVQQADTVKLVRTMPPNLQQAEHRNLSERLNQLDRNEHRIQFEQTRHRQSKSVAGVAIDIIEWQEGIYIDCAGLVLLHPFLPQFFQALAIAAEDVLLQVERAVCLLHYLASGQTLFPEYLLILPKVLCNLAAETPLATNVVLSDSELEEADGLLDATIRHWTALGSTSADGLRGSFLVRPGKITLREDGDYLLQVESRGYDILLDQLPWGIGMIRLPWMERMLWVEWIC